MPGTAIAFAPMKPQIPQKLQQKGRKPPGLRPEMQYFKNG
jgi:hypothetical protein